MPLYYLRFGFVGTGFHGYQTQDNGLRTSQQEIEEKLSVLFREKITITGASRTDTGVHILESFAHFRTEQELPPNAVRRMNFMLPDDIQISHLNLAPEGFHSRFDAIQRQYIYYIHYHKDPFLLDRSLHFPYRHLDLDKMNEAATHLKEQTDFATFCKRNSDNKTTRCRIDYIQWTKIDENRIQFEVHADRFLRGMVRGLVGTMMKVGNGKTSFERFKEIVASHDNINADFSVPGCGLFLTRVKYPDDLEAQLLR
ncbi:MAG: tRNA pseudouridine(38-40) synthase TruA [Chitinophagales bacterium]|nr:tRNA pseudouridine(38-40) synthase TruA [Chitinophagales bacterium]